MKSSEIQSLIRLQAKTITQQEKHLREIKTIHKESLARFGRGWWGLNYYSKQIDKTEKKLKTLRKLQVSLKQELKRSHQCENWEWIN